MNTTMLVALRLMQGLMAYHRYRVEGMENVPRVGPALIAVNHSLATYDSFLLAAKIQLDTGRYPAGLADKRIFQTPGLAGLFARLGAVEGSPAAGEVLLRAGNLLMLAPGGMKESLRPTSQRYRITWENRRGFARLAIRTQAPVLLAACRAADDIYTVYDNPVTPAVYRYFKWPLPLARGIGLTAIPRPVKLTHVISEPFLPPPMRGDAPDEESVAAFHATLVREMERLLKSRY